MKSRLDVGDVLFSKQDGFFRCVIVLDVQPDGMHTLLFRRREGKPEFMTFHHTMKHVSKWSNGYTLL